MPSIEDSVSVDPSGTPTLAPSGSHPRSVMPSISVSPSSSAEPSGIPSVEGSSESPVVSHQ